MEQLQKVKDHEKRVKSSFQVHLGVDPPSQEEQERVAALRSEHAARTRAREVQAAACRTETELHVAGALCTRTSGVVGVRARPCEVVAESSTPGLDPVSDGAGQANSGGHDCETDGPSEYVMDALHCGLTFNDLAKRAFSRKRFVEAARIVVIR